MISFNLIDIQVEFIKNPKMSKRLLVEGDQSMDMLCNTIKDVYEIFPKLSGLNNSKVINLKKKIENGSVDLKMSGKIQEQIKQKDIIYFDFLLNEVWVEVVMTLKDTKIFKKISFELRVESKTTKKKLKNDLIYYGISFLGEYKKENNLDYFLFS